jgi:hypothetical protein
MYWIGPCGRCSGCLKRQGDRYQEGGGKDCDECNDTTAGVIKGVYALNYPRLESHLAP